MVEPRSVIPGRQRWDVGAVLHRPDAARLLEAGLQDWPGVITAQANPVTGRLLVCHDASLSADEVGQLVRQAVGLVVGKVSVALTVVPGPVADAMPVTGQAGRRVEGGGSKALVGIGALALGVSALVGGPLVRLAAVLAAAAAVVGRSWRKSRSRSGSGTNRSVRHPLMSIVGSHKRQFYIASFLSVLGQMFYLAPALFVGWMLSVLTAGPSVILIRLGIATAAGQLWFLAGATAAALVSYAVVSFISGVSWRNLAQTASHEWRTTMYAHVQRTELRYLEGERTTRLAGVLTDDIDQLGRFLAGSANELLQLGTTFVVLVPVFLITAPSLAWIAFLPVPVIAWLSFYYQEQVAPGNAARGQSGSLLSSQLINNLEASATIKSFGAESYEIDRIRRLSEEYRLDNGRVDTGSTAYNQTVQVCAIGAFFGVLLFGGLEVLAGTLSLEVYNALIGLPFLLLGRLPGLGASVEEYERTIAALVRVLELRSMPVESEATGRFLDVMAVKGDLLLDGVTFAYPGRPPVLQNVSLRVAAKRTTAIVGVTGAGKTTIAKLMLRLQEVDSGRVLLDGVDIRELRLHDLRAAIGFVAQDAFLFDGTIGDNISYGTFDADLDRVVSAARLAEAEGFVGSLSQGYATMIGERGVALSGGQRQRLSLARAIVKAAPILVLDEATSAVDNETEAAIQHALADFARDRTLVIIAHRLSTIRHADWIYVLGAGGAIVEEGTHQELLERDGVYASLWRLQIGEVV